MKQEPNKEQEQQDNRLHFSDYFGAPGGRLLAVIFGVIAGGALALFFGWQIGVLAGAVTTLLVSIILPILLYRADVPYARIKETIKSKFLFDERVRFTVRGGRTVGGFFILTDKAMIFLSLEGGDHRLEISREEVKSIVLEENELSIKIFLSNTQFIRVMSGVCYEMYGVLRENNWI